ncbi:MAG: vitamin K epoxide reductase family protein [bacterium]
MRFVFAIPRLALVPVLALSIWGVFVCRYLVALHYSDREHVRGLVERYPALRVHVPDPDDPYEWMGAPARHACDVNDFISCGCVDRSRYSEIAGIGVAVFGLAGYAALALLSVLGLIFGGGARLVHALIYAGALGAFAFTAWLNYLEFFVIKCLCPHCTVSAGIITAILIILIAAAAPFRRLRRAKTRWRNSKTSMT